MTNISPTSAGASRPTTSGSPEKNIASASKPAPAAAAHWTWLSAFFLVFGVGALAYTVSQVGFKELGLAFAAIDGLEYTVLLFYPFVSIWDAWGWRYVFPPRLRRLPVIDLFLVRLAGEALNNTTPFFDFGGEPLKASLLHRRLGVDKPSAVSATIVAKTFLFYSEVAFWFCGLIPVLVAVPASTGWKGGLALFCLAALFFSVLLLLSQRKGFLSACLRLARRVAPRSHLLERLQAPLESTDAAMKQVYHGGLWAPLAAFLLHFAGWVAGSIETYLMFLVLGLPVTLSQAVAIEALLQLTRTASCFVPASLGVQEAGMALYAGWFGASAPIGVAVSLLKRARQFLWNAAGFAVWGYYETRRHPSR